MKNNIKKFDSLFLDEDTYSYVSKSTVVEVRIAENYIDIVGFSYDVNMVNPYFDECDLYITMTYEDAQALVVLLGYELYHAEIADIGVEIPVEMRSLRVNICQHEIWVNPKNNPFENNPAEEYEKF